MDKLKLRHPRPLLGPMEQQLLPQRSNLQPQQHLLQPRHLPLLFKANKLHKPMPMGSTIMGSKDMATMGSNIMLLTDNSMVSNMASSNHKQLQLDITNSNNNHTGKTKTKLTVSNKLSMGKLQLSKHRQVMAKINRSKEITDKTRANKIIPPQILMVKIRRSKDIKVNSRAVTITNKEIMDKGDTRSKGIIIKTKVKAETVILVQINRKETAPTMDKVNKISGLGLKEAMIIIPTGNMEGNKIMETRIPEVVIMEAIVTVAIVPSTVQEAEVEVGSKVAAVVASIEAVEVEEEGTLVEEEAVLIDMTITTTNTVVVAVECPVVEECPGEE